MYKYINMYKYIILNTKYLYAFICIKNIYFDIYLYYIYKYINK